MTQDVKRVNTTSETQSNPAPAVAAIVLNERREVLLVKGGRDFDCGGWRLPMGFPRVGERMPAAATRALREETGVEAQVGRLLEVDRCATDKCGELLLATFEMTTVRCGCPEPGTASEIRYFPLSRFPKLALPTQERALRACADVHLETWAIQDSFERLQNDDGRAMLSDYLVHEIETNASEIADAWLADVLASKSTSVYRTIDGEKLRERVTSALSQFGRWLRGAEGDDELRAFYTAVGRERREQGFAPHDVFSALALLKKHVWLHGCARSISGRPIEAYRGLELSRRIATFFDKAVYHAIRGFCDKVV